MTEQELQDEVFSYIEPAENRGEPCISDGYNENELHEALRKVVSKYKEKADKWDKLEAEVAKFYCDKDGEYNEDEPEEQSDLADIGEVCAMAMGWL